MALVTARSRHLGADIAIPAAIPAGVAAMIVASACTMAQAQMPIGSVSTLDATVTGATSVVDERAQLSNSGTVIAKDHVAYVQLFRGGSVKVCATSGVHLTAGTPLTAPPDLPSASAAGAVSANPSTPAPPPDSPPAASPYNEKNDTQKVQAAWAANMPPLMVALDRGAMELRMSTIAGDIVMTPDLRFAFSGDGQLDVHIRVTRNGDTCVENRVAGLNGHPELRVGSLFGNETYNILPGQHVLFEGGSLREVVDNESSPCGCPEAGLKPPAPPEGDLSLNRFPQSSTPPAAVQNPFPAAVSQGLAPPPPVPQAPPGVVHTQVAASLVYNPPPPPETATNVPPAKDAAAKVPVPVQKKGFFQSIGRFFKGLF